MESLPVYIPAFLLLSNLTSFTPHASLSLLSLIAALHISLNISAQ